MRNPAVSMVWNQTEDTASALAKTGRTMQTKAM